MTDTTEAPVPGSPEHNEKMAAEFDRRSDPATYEQAEELPGKPENGHDKFYDPKTGAYDWKAHAAELEFKLSGKKTTDEPVAETSEDAEEAPAGEDAALKGVLDRAGLKVDDLREQIATTGHISDAAKEALVKTGIDADLIDEYVELSKFKAEKTKEAQLAAFGGAEQFEAISKWAVESLSEGEIARINKLLADPEQFDTAVELLAAKYQAGQPGAGEGDLVIPGPTGANGAVPFLTRREQSNAINDPRYKNDPEYRRTVMQRMQVSDFSRSVNY